MNVTKLSSIPGRMRLGIEDLKGNSNVAINLKNILKNVTNIQCINISVKTGHILLIYNSYYIDEDTILSILSSSSIKEHNLNNVIYDRSRTKIYPKELSKDIKSLSQKLITLSISAASILFFSSNPMNAICALIFGFPGVIYLTSYLSFKYTLTKAYLNDIYIKDINSVKNISYTKSISIHPNIVFNNNSENFESIAPFRIESLMSTNKIADPINIDVRKLIKYLRIIGINNITIISKYKNNNLILYANKSLGIYATKESVCNNLIIINENSLKEINNGIILCISSSEKLYEDNIDIACHELYQIPWLIKECINAQEHLVRAQAISVSINVFGIFLSFIKHISLSGSIILYLLNTFGNLFYIKHKTLYDEKNNNKELLLWKTEKL